MSKRKLEDIQDFVPTFIKGDNHLLPDSADGNGLIIGSLYYLPEEVMTRILSNIDANKLLEYSLVCRKWNNLIKSYHLWALMYKNKYNRKAKKLPWYVYYCILSTNYFDTNLVKNRDGEEGLYHWNAKSGDGSYFVEHIKEDILDIEPQTTIDNHSSNNSTLWRYTSCFVAQNVEHHKSQVIKLGKSKLFQYVLDSYKPHIYLSEFVSVTDDYECLYILGCNYVFNEKNYCCYVQPCAMHYVTSNQDVEWEKIWITVTQYPEALESIVFESLGKDAEILGYECGSRTTGAVVKLLSESIEPLSINKQGHLIPKPTFLETEFNCNGLSKEEKKKYKDPCSDRYYF